MNRKLGMLAATFAAAASLGLAGCEDQGPMESAGEEVDEAIEDVGNGGETLGNRIDDAVDDVREGVEDAAEEVRESTD